LTSKMELEKAHTGLVRLHDSANKAIERLTEQNIQLQGRIMFLEAQLKNADQAVQIHKKINIDYITQAEIEKQQISQRVVELKQELQRLKNGN